MSFNIKKDWDEESGLTIVTVTDNDKTYCGTSKCHPDDVDFKSQDFGESVATERVVLQFLRNMRDNELIPQIKILKHLYSNMTTSKQFNPKSYEATMVRRQLHILEGQLTALKEQIRERKDLLDYLIDSKESFNNLIRSKRDNS